MENLEDRTVVGVFDDYTAARASARELEAAGIAPAAMRLHSNMATGAAGYGSTAGTERPGGISGFFSRLFGGGSEDEADHYAEAVRRGNTVMAVTAPEDQIDRVIEIMNQHGATDIDRHIESYRLSGYERFDPNAAPYTHEEATQERERFREANRSIPVVQEEVKIGKRAVRRGGVRVYTRVVEEPVTEEVRLREEHATVERRKVDRPVEAGDEGSFRDQTIEVTETAEEPVISKTARVTEEVVVGKEAKERTENIRETARHTEVNVEPSQAGTEAAAIGNSTRNQIFLRDYGERYAKTGKPFESFRSAYEFGYEKALAPAYRGKSWPEADSQLEKEFRSLGGGSLKWSDAKDAVRRGWDYGKTEANL